MLRKPKSRRLTIFLLKQDVQLPNDAIEPDEEMNWKSLPLDPGVGVGTFFWKWKDPRVPEWVEFVSPLIGAVPDGLKTASASGLLVIKVGERFFAITFGYGRSLLNPDTIEPAFGLKVCLNRIDPSRIRSMDTKTYEDVVVAKKTQVSKNSNVPTFGIDISTDILRAVTGIPRDTEFARALSGADALVVNRPLNPTDLITYCGDLLAAFSESTYKESFSWIDDLAPTEKSIAVQLDAMMLTQLQNRDTSTTYLAVPDVIEWEDIDAFQIAGARDIDYDDLDLNRYLGDLGADVAMLSLDLLKRRAVRVRYSRTGETASKWKLYQCIVSEQQMSDRLYVLLEGRWFSVSEDLSHQVNAYCDSLPSSAFQFPPAKNGESEPVYNKRLRDEFPEQLLWLDTRVERPGGASSSIEVCDILTMSGEFVHIKRKSASSTLSHLFAQGSVSAEAFIRDGVLRDKIRTEIETRPDLVQREKWLALIPDHEHVVSRSNMTVSYAVITHSRGTRSWLPFFSKLNLMQHGRILANLQVNITMTRIDIE